MIQVISEPFWRDLENTVSQTPFPTPTLSKGRPSGPAPPLWPRPSGPAPPLPAPGTCTERPSVFVVTTVVHAPAEALAGCQAGLSTFTVNVVQQNMPGAVAEKGISGGGQGGPTAQLAAHDSSIRQPPVIVADRAPQATMQDLHSALTGARAAHQAHAALTW